MNAECRIESDSTIFRFCVTRKGFDDCGYSWTDAVITVNNSYFNYKTSNEFLEFREMASMFNKLEALLSNTLTEVYRMEFIEPDVQIVFNPRHEEFGDIVAEFFFYPFLDGALTEQHYVLPLYRDDIEELVTYLSDMIDKLK